MRVPVLLSLLVGLTTACTAQELLKPKFLFDYVPGESAKGMVDIANCLENPRNPTTDPDAGRWVAIVVLNRQNRVPSCAQCYTHIDGANIVGVLPIIKDTLREPFVIHSSRFENHGVPWFWGPSRPDYSPAVNILDPSSTTFLSNLTNQVTRETLQSFVSGPAPKFSYPQYATQTQGQPPNYSVLRPYTQGIKGPSGDLPGTVFQGSYLTVPDTIAELPTTLDFSAAGSVPYPMAAFLFPGGAANLADGTLATDKTIELQNRTGRSLLVAQNLALGSLVRRSDPVLTANQQTDGTENYARMYWPAKEYYTQAAFASQAVATDLQLCGVDYQVKEYGTIHPDVMAGLKTATEAWNGSANPGAFWILTDGSSVSDEGRASFNAVTGYWTGKM